MNTTLPNGLQSAIKFFAKPENAFAFFKGARWPNGVACPRCGSVEHSFVRTRFIWNCKGCKKQFSVKVNTVMEDSPLTLEKWAVGFWLMANCKNGVSSHEVGRALEITQKSAWFMLHRIRLAMQTGTFEKLSGTIEADETYIGGKEANKHKDKKLNAGRGAVGKAIVMGVIARHGEIRTKHIPNTRKHTIHSEIRANVEPGSELFTDELKSYRGLRPDYVHETVNHIDEWVRGNVHTNHLENYWSLFKRCFHGTWTHLSDEHLHRYLVEQEYRFNSRKQKDGERFAATVGQIEGKRLTYKELIAAG